MADPWDRPIYSIAEPSGNPVVMALDDYPYTLWPFSTPLLSTELSIVNLQRSSLCSAVTSKSEYCYFKYDEIINVLHEHRAARSFKIFFGSTIINGDVVCDDVWKNFLSTADEVTVEGTISFPALQNFMFHLNAPSTFICRSYSVEPSCALPDNVMVPRLHSLKELHFNFRPLPLSMLHDNLDILHRYYSESPSLTTLNLSFGQYKKDQNWHDVTTLIDDMTLQNAYITVLVDEKKNDKWEKEVLKRYQLHAVGHCLDGLGNNIKRYAVFTGQINGRLYRFLWKVEDH